MIFEVLVAVSIRVHQIKNEKLLMYFRICVSYHHQTGCKNILLHLYGRSGIYLKQKAHGS
jgi:hypothetical protein